MDITPIEHHIVNPNSLHLQFDHPDQLSGIVFFILLFDISSQKKVLYFFFFLFIKNFNFFFIKK
jgi:hypothetical protein